MNKFKVGDRVVIVASIRSDAAREHLGAYATITAVGDSNDHWGYWYSLSVGKWGAWEDELERAKNGLQLAKEKAEA
jgi:hypothetical protein